MKMRSMRVPTRHRQAAVAAYDTFSPVLTCIHSGLQRCLASHWAEGCFFLYPGPECLRRRQRKILITIQLHVMSGLRVFDELGAHTRKTRYFQHSTQYAIAAIFRLSCERNMFVHRLRPRYAVRPTKMTTRQERPIDPPKRDGCRRPDRRENSDTQNNHGSGRILIHKYDLTKAIRRKRHLCNYQHTKKSN